tara:strand:+ start:1012 stop:1170 length:159 start_codon:yes stop_codon:yes gene_type:complete
VKIGDIVCKFGKKACIIEIAKDYATVIFLNPGMYMPETFKLNELELVEDESK